jgi:hypothetical protein
MGLLVCPAIFQRPMEKVMDSIENVIVCIENLLIHSKNHKANLITLDKSLQRISDNNLKINL